MRVFWILGLALACAGCATIIEGATQTITFDANAPNAVCTITRQGEVLGQSTPERRVVTISKSQHDLTISCVAPGYLDKTDILSSNLSAATVVSFLLIDFGIVDAISGAWKKYPDRITMLMQPQDRPQSAAPRSRRPRSASQ